MAKIGACGFVPLLQHFVRISPVALIRIDDDMNPIRDENGFCIECKRGEKGLLIGIIGTKAQSAYSGYANNAKASNSKIIENVFKNGQRAFNSGNFLQTLLYLSQTIKIANYPLNSKSLNSNSFWIKNQNHCWFQLKSNRHGI